ncbi:MAG: hypothetical protein K2L49_09580 [Muribaculaceae bacterium]|nr:hypothetical protein [Muribaculaceae bacterium]
MTKNKFSNRKRMSLFTAGGLMIACALLYWICDIGTIFALCMAAAGFCLFAAGLNAKAEEKD